MSGIRAGVLQRLNRYSISVKDIANQAWCEKQMELYLIHGMKTTYAMEQGQAVHEVMQERIFVPLRVEPVNYADRLYKTAYENYTSLATLNEKGFCRELRLYGSLNGYRVSGQIDELQLQGDQVMIVEDKTIKGTGRWASSRTKPDTLQVSMYRKLLEEMRNGSYTIDNFLRAYSIEQKALSPQFAAGLDSMGVKDELRTLPGIYGRMFERFHSMPAISDILEVRYFDRKGKSVISSIKVSYDKESTEKWISHSMKYWNGEREAEPVPEDERWKCNICQFFRKECFVWA